MFHFLTNPHKLSTEEWQTLLGNAFVTSIIYHIYRIMISPFFFIWEGRSFYFFHTKTSKEGNRCSWILVQKIKQVDHFKESLWRSYNSFNFPVTGIAVFSIRIWSSCSLYPVMYVIWWGARSLNMCLIILKPQVPLWVGFMQLQFPGCFSLKL